MRLGYLVDRNAPFQTLQRLVAMYADSADIDNAGVADSLSVKLQQHQLRAFVSEVKAQEGKHLSEQAGQTLRIVGYALTR